MIRETGGIPPPVEPYEGLERYDGKLSRTVLKGGGATMPLPYLVLRLKVRISMNILETDRLILCKLSPDDAAFILELLNDPSILAVHRG